jgi:Cupin-like domain
MANILTQIIGKKEIIVFPPSTVNDLDIPPGASSSRIANIFESEVRRKGFTGTLKPGDVVYIPPLWPHATKPLTANIGINVFWKNFGDGVYDRGKDVYGNKDLICYTEGRKMLERVVKGFKDVDVDVREFYMRRLTAELEGSTNKA